MLVYRTAGGGGWKDRLDRPAGTVARDVSFGLVSREHAQTAYGVILAADGSLDEAATEAERTRQRTERGDAQAFDFGPSLSDALANCEAETGLEPPTPARPLRWSPLEPGDGALKRRDADGRRPPAIEMDDAAFYRERDWRTAGLAGGPPARDRSRQRLHRPVLAARPDLDSVVATRRLIDAAVPATCRSSSRRSPSTREEPGGCGVHGQGAWRCARSSLARGGGRSAWHAAHRHADHEAVRLVLLRHGPVVAARGRGLRHRARHGLRHRAARERSPSTPCNTAIARSCRGSAWAIAHMRRTRRICSTSSRSTATSSPSRTPSRRSPRSSVSACASAAWADRSPRSN